jgi:hypothetical protein
MKENRTYPLRLRRSLKEAVERLSREDGTSINQFVATALAEKVSALETTRLFTDQGPRRFHGIRQEYEPARREVAARGRPTTVMID